MGTQGIASRVILKGMEDSYTSTAVVAYWPKSYVYRRAIQTGVLSLLGLSSQCGLLMVNAGRLAPSISTPNETLVVSTETDTVCQSMHDCERYPCIYIYIC